MSHLSCFPSSTSCFCDQLHLQFSNQKVFLSIWSTRPRRDKCYSAVLLRCASRATSGRTDPVSSISIVDIEHSTDQMHLFGEHWRYMREVVGSDMERKLGVKGSAFL